MSKTQTITFTALSICVLFIFANSAKGQDLPPGSYKLTCQNISVSGSIITALCKPKQGNINATPYTKLNDLFLCDGDIRNNDGTLECTKNENSALMKKAKTAVKAAYKQLFGRDLATSVNPWLREFFKANKYAGTFFFNGLQVGIVGQFMQSYLREPQQSKYRQLIINNAFADVCGRQTNAAEMTFWDSEMTNAKGFYGHIFDTEIKKLNSSKINRRFMVTAAYKKLLGRPALGKELDYWEPRTEVFSQIIDYGRDWLYSESGAKDLNETIGRALYNKTGEKPTAKQTSDAKIKYTKTKAIFAEM